jgi:Uma2 family endonuclease
MSPTLKLPFNLTVAEFLVWCPEDGQRWQLVDGEPVAMAPPRPAHGILQSRLAAMLVGHLDATRPRCVVVTTPGIVPALRAGMNFRVPDLAVSCTPPAANDISLRDPVLVIEILSPSNVRETRMNVWTYTTIPSVLEILVVHAEVQRVEILRRQADGNWPQDPEIVEAGDLVLDSIGFRAPLVALYRTAG